MRSVNSAKRYARVVRSRAGFGVVLHAERAEMFGAHSLEITVVQIEVRDGRAFGERSRVDRVVVVLARDLDPPGREIAHRMIATVMPEPELERGRAQRERHDLVTETDAEDRQLPEERGDVVARVVDRARIARTVREEHAVGLARQAPRPPLSTRARLRPDSPPARVDRRSTA